MHDQESRGPIFVNIITNVLFHFRPRRRLIESNGRATVVVDLTESDDG